MIASLAFDATNRTVADTLLTLIDVKLGIRPSSDSSSSPTSPLTTSLFTSSAKPSNVLTASTASSTGAPSSSSYFTTPGSGFPVRTEPLIRPFDILDLQSIDQPCRSGNLSARLTPRLTPRLSGVVGDTGDTGMIGFREDVTEGYGSVGS